MNLTNFRETPLGRVVEMIRREAQRFGVGIHHSELVGLIPQDALVEAAVWYTQLDQFSPDQILESRINLNVSSPSTDSRPAGEGTSFLDEVAAATAAPGGGSAAAYAGALGAALTTMVAGLTLGKKKYIAVEAEMQAIRIQAEELRKELTNAVEDDSAAFEAVMGAFKLPKDTEDQQKGRQAAIKIATLNAARVPLHTVAGSVKVLELAGRCARDGNLNAISDAMSGAAMARAALTAAGYNVRINLNSLDDKSAGEKMLKELRELEKKADKIEKEIRKTMEVRGGVS
jgi:glutamate formiminotransferase/formiminotetrahydrofolate cyclodeaminase